MASKRTVSDTELRELVRHQIWLCWRDMAVVLAAVLGLSYYAAEYQPGLANALLLNFPQSDVHVIMSK